MVILYLKKEPLFCTTHVYLLCTSPHAETFSSATDSGRLHVCIEEKLLLWRQIAIMCVFLDCFTIYSSELYQKNQTRRHLRSIREHASSTTNKTSASATSKLIFLLRALLIQYWWSSLNSQGLVGAPPKLINDTNHSN